MNNEQLKKLHKEKNIKAINENLYKANIKLVDMNRYLKLEIERLNNIIDKAREYIQDRYDGEVLTHTFDKDNVGELLNILKDSDKE